MPTKSKMSEVQGLQFGDFGELSPEDQKRIQHVLHQDCKAVELYWTRQRQARPPVVNGFGSELLQAPQPAWVQQSTLPADSTVAQVTFGTVSTTRSPPKNQPQMPAWSSSEAATSLSFTHGMDPTPIERAHGVGSITNGPVCEDQAKNTPVLPGVARTEADGSGSAAGASHSDIINYNPPSAVLSYHPPSVPPPVDPVEQYAPPPPPPREAAVDTQTHSSQTPSSQAPSTPSSLHTKTYERRNKKRRQRPPGYYNKSTEDANVKVDNSESCQPKEISPTVVNKESSPTGTNTCATEQRTPSTGVTQISTTVTTFSTPVAHNSTAVISDSPLKPTVSLAPTNLSQTQPAGSCVSPQETVSSGPGSEISVSACAALSESAAYGATPHTTSQLGAVSDQYPQTKDTRTHVSAAQPAATSSDNSIAVDTTNSFSDSQNFPALERNIPSGSKPAGPVSPLQHAGVPSAPAKAAISSASAPVENKSVWGSKPKGSWSALFKGSESSSADVSPVVRAAAPAQTAPPAEPEAPQVKQPVSAAQDNNAKQLGCLLEKYELVHRPEAVMPRGLVNRGNWCYINGTLQALVCCPPFYHLMKSMPSFPALVRGPSSTPVIDCLVEFLSEFAPYVPNAKPVEKLPVRKEPGSSNKVSQDMFSGVEFEPKNVYKMLQVMKSEAEFKHGRQEDAEEFLSCMLNGLHDEMVAAINQFKYPDGKTPATNGNVAGKVDATDAEQEEGEDDQWEQVGPKNKSQVTRSANCVSSPISDIFRGQIRSILHQPGNKESATLQPFFTLQLDIHHDSVRSVKDALEQMVSKESLQGFTCSKTKQEVEATRRITLETLPPVLVLHLKCFVYDKSGGSQKLLKRVDFSEQLDISKDLLSPNIKSKLHPMQRTYKLFAVLNHHGPRAVGGHYTTDIFHPGHNGWLHCDDSTIRPITVQQLLKFSQPKVPYLLYYHRADLL